VNAHKALLVGAAGAVALGGIAAGITIGLRDASPQPLADSTATQSAGDFRTPRTEPASHGPTKAARRAWSLTRLMARFAAHHAAIRGRRIPIRPETTLCSGRGKPLTVGAISRWQAFDCTYTTFTGGIDRDLEFRVDVLGKRTVRLSDFRWVGGR
jgi:hypothetical protein